MHADAYKALLKALQKLERRIAQEHLAAIRAGGPLGERVAALHAVAETGGSADDFAKILAGRAAVRFLLRTVFVRVLEDTGLLEPWRVRGRKGMAALQELAPTFGARSLFAWTFRDLAVDLPALFGVDGDELPLPSEDLCREVRDLWNEEDGAGGLLYDWRGEGFDSRFLGDLYQDLDADIRKRYALLQTPRFVEAFILDRTLTPALGEFDPAALRARGEAFRLLDPTCGSGHFLIGAFQRLADWWQGRGAGPREACERALESVWGADINPHAVDIARFRLLLEVRARVGAGTLEDLAALGTNLRVMDSLVPWERPLQGELWSGTERLAAYGDARERAENAEFLGRAFHVVVGNPPYITPKDPRKRDDYRAFWPDSAAGKYALSAPFAERLFALGARGAWVGQITANSFMKREFGKKLVQVVLPRWDLTAVVDTSGAYIPGHGTPTVILVGRAQRPVGDSVWAVLGKRGEPKRPAVPEQGLVWSAIAGAGEAESDESPYVTVAKVERRVFGEHPWSLGGGAAGEVKTALDDNTVRILSQITTDLGFASFSGNDGVFLGPATVALTHAVEPDFVRPLVCGEDLRDYSVHPGQAAIAPYGRDGVLVDVATHRKLRKHLWPWRATLLSTMGFGGKTRADTGEPWWQWFRWVPSRYTGLRLIAWPYVATHQSFVLSDTSRVYRGGASAPVMKLPATATLDDHLDLLGLLNSSALGFWMKQVFHCKGEGGGTRVEAGNSAMGAEEWKNHYEYDSTKLQQAPLTRQDRPARVALAAALDAAATDRAACLPAAVLASAAWSPASPAPDAPDLPTALGAARDRYRALTHRMVALQEELDWLTYGSYALIAPLPTVAPDAVEPLVPGHRPFEILLARADDEADEDERSAWWSRHGHDRVTEIPDHYSEPHKVRLAARVAAIEEDARLQLLEQPAFKRRWQTPDLDAEAKKACEAWLLDRLEDLFAPGGPLSEARPYTLEAVAQAFTADPRVAAVAGVATGQGAQTDLTLLCERLLRGAALPDNPLRVYTDEGLRTLAAWKEVWALQDREDAGETVTIPAPPKWSKGDFRRAEHFATRGKLNVPRERFVHYADLSPPRWGWNGWRDLERAVAQVHAWEAAEQHPHDPLPKPTAADPRRCGATVGLWESLPDVRRWRSEAEHGELRSLAEEACGQAACPCDVAKAWRAWQDGQLSIARPAPEAPVTEGEATVEERAHLAQILDGFGIHGARLAELERRWLYAPERLALVLDDLIAAGAAEIQGKGRGRRYVRHATTI